MSITEKEYDKIDKDISNLKSRINKFGDDIEFLYEYVKDLKRLEPNKQKEITDEE